MSKQHVLTHSSLGGKLTGTVDESGGVARYRGLQYATIDKRWTRSKLLATLPGDIDARKFGPRCPQPDEPNHTIDFGPYLPFEHDGQDDLTCLNLNVTCPKEGHERLPVFFWIHGGSLTFGAGSDPIWEPTRLVQRSIEEGAPIVVVTVNYRVGPFGFLSPIDKNDDTTSQGNFGFHDQINALEWCQRHIAGFGGDPRRVTVAGESAGGCSTHALIAYQEKLGDSRFFNRAIMQSGTFAVMGFWDRKKMDQIWNDALAEMRADKHPDPLETMRGLHWQRLLYIDAFNVGGYGVYCDDTFVSPPCFGTAGNFLEYEPKTVEAVMHGDNADEGNIFRGLASGSGVLEQLRSVAERVMRKQGCDELLDIYGLSNPAQLSKEEITARLTALPEDARFFFLSEELARVWPKAAFYHLTPKSPFFTSRFPDECFHTQDLLYLFGNFDHDLEAEGKADHLRVGDEIKTTWLRFINGKEPWEKAFEGTAATFEIGETRHGSMAQSRGWNAARQHRMDRLKKVDFAQFVEVATAVFP